MSFTETMPDWSRSLVSNLGMYVVIVGVSYIVIKHIKAQPSLDAGDQSLYARFVRFMILGYDDVRYQPLSPSAGAEFEKPTPKPEPSFYMKGLQLAFCVVGLLGSYLMWGVLQERIMVTNYSFGSFESSLFLVFCNRVLALSVAITVITFTKQPALRAPFYKFSMSALSNVVSSWCQLEALKHVSFPTQVLAKSSKLIPVMILGKYIARKVYPWQDYFEAVVICIGVATFTLNSKTSTSSQETSLSGVFLIGGYLTFDSFTSQWQGHLFSEYKMSSYQMMLGTNAFSCFFTFVSLLRSGELFTSFNLVSSDPTIALDILMFSCAGASGQMFIFYTIKTFGPVVFTMIMTTRQLIAIVLSCVLYGHAISSGSMVGIVIVFSTIGYRIHRNHQNRKKKSVNQ